MIFYPEDRLTPVNIVVFIEPNAADGEYSFNALLDTVRNWRGFGYRFQVDVHVYRPGLINEDLIGNADELWFFGTALCDGQEPTVKLTREESALIQVRMDMGVGVFATGDHVAIGSGLCGELPPRAANMRTWSGVRAPTEQRPMNIESTIRSADRDLYSRGQHAADGREDRDDFDALPKPIWVLHEPNSSPHELLQLPVKGSRKTAIRFLPDHAHEGKLHDYAASVGSELAALAAEYRSGPMPRIVARSACSVFNSENNPIDCASYPVVSAYEAPADSPWGNIVVDSTFHHWTDENAVRLRFTPAWLHVEQYAINVANWLMGAAGRQKVFQSVVEYIRETGEDGARVIQLLGNSQDKDALSYLWESIGKRMGEQRVVADTLERILLGGVVSASPDTVERFLAQIGNEHVDPVAVQRLDDANKQRLVLGLEFAKIRLSAIAEK
ncbi:hypothetical protein DFR29_103322 [Tahibacter aquaticus]|uniref:Uncharacterized protein n=1 Tax=Tahibacter aquaticus TaxID=520092 RepID=A0A4V6PYG2_9GAMM|nr:hypothetical protein [Tahibacter aquaticus]TDR46786.1 hypothetical protein DFR29_103322 [Tahibacter aquaticus]